VIIATRLVLVLVGAAAVLWSVISVPRALAERRLERLSDAMVDGERFDLEGAKRLIAYLDATAAERDCMRGGTTAVATIRLYWVGQAIRTKDPKIQADASASAAEAIKTALACSPHQANLWFQLFWLESVADPAPNDRKLALLRLSYELGPHEGWIASHRARRALTLYDALPKDIQSYATREFVLMVRDNPVRAARTFERLPRAVRDVLRPMLEQVPLDARTRFALALDDLDPDIPGVDVRALMRK
jgi:hypothetical protein